MSILLYDTIRIDFTDSFCMTLAWPSLLLHPLKLREVGSFRLEAFRIPTILAKFTSGKMSALFKRLNAMQLNNGSCNQS